MDFVIIIPARFCSSRFPGKPLACVKGKPMVVRVMEHALMSNAKKVIIATDHINIVRAIEEEQTVAEVFLSKISHQSGIERLEEVVNEYGFTDSQVIVNLQGDEPLVSPNMINLVAKDLLSNKNVDMSTLAVRIISIKDKYNSNTVKVVIDIKGNALYFSRSMIPWCKKEFLSDMCTNAFNNVLLLRHIGIYSYRVNFIHLYNNWETSPLEQVESLEQLRVLWHGGKIHVSVIDDNICWISVDTLEELNQVNEFFEK